MSGDERRLTRREFLGLAAASTIGGAVVLAACRTRKKSVSFLNWEGYIGRDTLARFEKETGIIVNYDQYDSEGTMFTKLAQQPGSYDLAVVPDQAVPLLRERRMLDRIQHGALKSLDGISERFRRPAYDPDLSFTVPYLWGTTGIGVDRRHVPRSPDSWWALWDERYKGRLSMLDNPHEVLRCALLLLGLPLDAKEPAQLEKARALLLRQRPLLKAYDSSSYAERLAAGEVWLAQAWSGDVLAAASPAADLDFVIPREGAFMWVDSLCLPEGSANSDAALRLIDYLLRPAVAAEIAETTRFATPNEKALTLLEPSLRADKRVYPDRDTLARLRFSPSLDAATQELWSRTWQEVSG